MRDVLAEKSNISNRQLRLAIEVIISYENRCKYLSSVTRIEVLSAGTSYSQLGLAIEIMVSWD